LHGRKLSGARELVSIPGGEITLHDEGTKRRWDVTLRPFFLSRYPVTRHLYYSVMGTPDDPAAQSRSPITDVSWIDAVRFCSRLSLQAGLTPCYSPFSSDEADDVVCDFDAPGYRLPSEAEWEHACRAGTNGVRYAELEAIAWYAGNSGGVLHDVGTKDPNSWGLYDMIGNVWEWCWDVFDPQVYGPYRVFRGGGFSDPPHGCRASCRRKSHPTFVIDDLGFRLARSR
jgi:formylglycine-generating enzyme required for sulfatase activity